MFHSRMISVNAIEPKRNKKVRSANFSEREIKLLCELVVKRPEIIESKNTDATTWRRKEQEWQAISVEFNNSTIDGFRTTKGLRTKYEAIKKEIRRKLLRRKMEMSEKDNVTYEDVEYNDNEKKILWLMSSSRESLENDKNSEAIIVMDPHTEFINCQNLNNMKIEIIKLNENDDTITEEDIGAKNERSVSPNILLNASNINILPKSSSINRQLNRKREGPKIGPLETVSEPFPFKLTKVNSSSDSISEEEYRNKERELKLKKLEAEVQSTMLDIEIKKLEKEIKVATLRKILCDN
nr:uncharacterized protein LOC111512472 isoform X1 [Leptinotarsa decemlineata]